MLWIEQFKEVVPFLKEVSLPVTQALGDSVNWVWQILLRQAQVEGALALLIAVGLFSTAWYFRKMMTRMYGEIMAAPDGGARMSSFFFLLIAFLSTIGASGLGLFYTRDAATALYNPEFYVMERVAQMAQKHPEQMQSVLERLTKR